MTSITSAGDPATAFPRELRSIDLDGPAEIVFQLDQSEVLCTESHLLDQGFTSHLIATATEAATCRVQAMSILSLSEESRQALVVMLTSVFEGRQSTHLCLRDGQVSGDFLPAAMDLLATCSAGLITKAAELVIEIAAITQSDAGIRIACSQIVDCLRQRHMTGLRASHFIEQAMVFRQQQRATQPSEQVETIQESWRDAPVSELLRVPQGWLLTEDGIVSHDGQEVIPCRLMMTQLFENIEGHEFSVELCWARGDHRWITRICQREQISNTASIVKLSNYGLPVTTNNAQSIIQYLADFERDNLELLPCSRIASRMGWFDGDNGQVFLCGQTPIFRQEELGLGRPQNRLTFLGDDDGDDWIADGVHSRGDFNTWLAATELVRCCPRVLLTLYASLATPLLHIVGAPNFVLSLDGRTSVGKTTAQMLAASCWGYPVINGGERSPAIRSWDTTPVFIERSAALSNGIPTIIDDTKVARRHEDIVSTVYQIANGGGRGRGTQRGLAITRNIQTILISSGEDPITSYSRAGGSRARVLGLWGSPFAAHTNASQAVVQLKDQISEHYGHAGHTLVQYLVDHQESWIEWRHWYQQTRRRYELRADGNAVAGRMATCFAVLELAAHLAHAAILFPFAYQDTVSSLWDEITADTDEADQGLSAMRFFISWIDSVKHRFHGAPSAMNEVPIGGWLGRWQTVGSDNVGCIVIHPHQLDDVLNERGFPAESIRRHWNENGWLRTEPGKTTKRVSIDGQKTYMVAIRWDVINQLMDGSERMREVRDRQDIRGNSGGTGLSHDYSSS